MMARHSLVQEEAPRYGHRMAIAQPCRIEIEDAGTRSVRRRGYVAGRHRALAKGLDATDLEACLRHTTEQQRQRGLDRRAKLAVGVQQLVRVRIPRGRGVAG